MVREFLEEAANKQSWWHDYVDNNQAALSDLLSTVSFDPAENKGLLLADAQNVSTALKQVSLSDEIIRADVLSIENLLRALFIKEAPVIIERLRAERRRSGNKLREMLRRKKSD